MYPVWGSTIMKLHWTWTFSDMLNGQADEGCRCPSDSPQIEFPLQNPKYVLYDYAWKKDQNYLLIITTMLLVISDFHSVTKGSNSGSYHLIRTFWLNILSVSPHKLKRAISAAEFSFLLTIQIWWPPSSRMNIYLWIYS